MFYSNFRIVAEKRGACVIGFRVQRHAWSRATNETIWRNVGKRDLDQRQAFEMKEFYQKEYESAHVAIDYETLG